MGQGAMDCGAIVSLGKCVSVCSVWEKNVVPCPHPTQLPKVCMVRVLKYGVLFCAPQSRIIFDTADAEIGSLQHRISLDTTAPRNVGCCLQC